MTSVKVLVVDDQQLVRDGIASLLGIQPGIEVVGIAADGAEAVAKALASAPDVVLMDVRMPGMDGVEATRELRRELPACRVVMLTTFDDDEYVTQALRAGASGYLLKDLGAVDLAAAVRLTHAGVAPLAAGIAARLAAAPKDHGGGALTAREVEILRLVAKGATNREIGLALFVSEGTVKNHVSRMLSRLGLRDRTQAAIYAREHGLLSD
ncbi:response regulator transcription factor [Dactylosporangium sp. NPDC049525]|uniref:response regulator transcription factor n=1 Tax=Dactylosporangium sp. NPDC049525 TaxID=3154730 RepID=UPI003449FF59